MRDGACEQEPEVPAWVVGAEVDADIGDGEVGAFADPAADLDEAEAEGIELQASGLG